MTNMDFEPFCEHIWIRTGGTLKNSDITERFWPVGITVVLWTGSDPAEIYGGEWKELTYEEAMRLFAEEEKEWTP